MFKYEEICFTSYVPLVRHSKRKFSCAVLISVVKFAQTNGHKDIKHEHKVGKNRREKKVRENKEKTCMNFIRFIYKSQQFAQGQLNFALSHNGETVTFRKSAIVYILYTYFNWFEIKSKIPNNPIVINVHQKNYTIVTVITF